MGPQSIVPWGSFSKGLNLTVSFSGRYVLLLQECQRTGSLLVHEPGQDPCPWSDDLSGEYVGLKRSFKHGVKRFGFGVATDEKRDLPGVIEKNRGEGDPGRFQFFDPGGGDEPARFMHGPGAGEERSGMPVRSHAQQDQIETRDVRFGDVELLTQHGFILAGNGVGIGEFAWHAINLRRGNGQVAEERFMGHSIITVGMIRWDVTFISPEKPDFRPIQLTQERRGGKHRIEACRGRASGQGEGKRIPRRDGPMRMIKKVVCRGFQHRLRRRVDVYVPLRIRHARRQKGEPVTMRSAAGIA